MSSTAKLLEVKRESVFTEGLEFEEFIKGLCNRYAKIYGEILPHGDYDYIVKRLSEKGII